MNRTEVVVQLTAQPGILFIKVQMLRSVKPGDVDRFMTALATAVADVEAMEENLMEALLFEHRQVLNCQTTLGVVLCREYSDPAYPRQIEQALRKIDINLTQVSVAAVETI